MPWKTENWAPERHRAGLDIEESRRFGIVSTFEKSTSVNYAKPLYPRESSFSSMEKQSKRYTPVVLPGSDEYVYRCEYCNKTFRSQMGLYYHKPIHTGEWKYVCDICDRGYMKLDAFNSHKRYHRDHFNKFS